MGRILWYAAVTWDYIRQMLPGILLAAAVFFAVRLGGKSDWCGWS